MLPTGGSPHLRRLLAIRGSTDEPATATGHPRLVFHFGDLPGGDGLMEGFGRMPPRVGLTGQLSHAFNYLHTSDHVDSLVAELDPLVLPGLVREGSIEGLTDRRNPIDALVGREWIDLYEQLAIVALPERPAVLGGWLAHKPAGSVT